MHVAPPDRDVLRRLADLRLDRPAVLSLYLGLDPSEFATPPARATAIRSLIDDAERRVKDAGGLEHDDRVQLERALERAREALEAAGADGAHGVAVFAAESLDVFEVVKLPRAVPNRVAIDRSPMVGPLVGLEQRERWCVALVNRQVGRVFRGSPEGLRETRSLEDEVHGRHDQGGWSQARYQRSVEKEKEDHLRNVADLLLTYVKRRPFEKLVVGGPSELVAGFEDKLHPYVKERLAGRIEVDVENTNADDVLAAAGPLLEELEDTRERDALERLGEASRSGGRAAAGLDDTLAALNERRVEILVMDERFAAPGTTCLECGWVGPAGVDACPADGTPLEQREDIAEAAVELALRQSADVLPIRRRRDELGDAGVGALLRF
jgi:peptide chain release factor subunit 1